MTTIGKLFVFSQFVLSMAMLALSVGWYVNHHDWDGQIKADAKKITELAAERDRAEARYRGATIALQDVEIRRPMLQRSYLAKLNLARTGKGPDGQSMDAAVTSNEFETNGAVKLVGATPYQYRGEDVKNYEQLQADLKRYFQREEKDGRKLLGLVPEQQDRIDALLKEYAQLTLIINGNGQDLRGLRKERELQEEAKARAIDEQGFLKPLLAHRYGEAVLLLKREQSMAARKTELEKVGVASSRP